MTWCCTDSPKSVIAVRLRGADEFVDFVFGRPSCMAVGIRVRWWWGMGVGGWGEIFLLKIFFFFFTTALSQWDFSHEKFGLPSTGKASCDRVALPNLRCMP